jgi:uncharacterized membrane protein
MVAVGCEPTSKIVSDFPRRYQSLTQTGELQMTKIKTLGATVLLVAAFAAPVFAQDGGRLGGRYGWEPSRTNSGMSNREVNEPGDFAVTGGVSTRDWNPTGQVDPGTSNSPAGNAGGE